MTRSVLTDRDLPLKTMGDHCKVLVLTVLLFGSESWAMCKVHFDQLTAFHRRCVRAMAHTSLWKTRIHRVTTTSLLESAGIRPLVQCFDERLQQWAGKLARMPLARMPRRMMTAWVPHRRPRGIAKTWGQTLIDCLKRNDVPTRLSEWVGIACDHDGGNASEAVLWLKGTKVQMLPSQHHTDFAFVPGLCICPPSKTPVCHPRTPNRFMQRGFCAATLSNVG